MYILVLCFSTHVLDSSADEWCLCFRCGRMEQTRAVWRLCFMKRITRWETHSDTWSWRVRTWSSVATASHTRQKARSTSAYRRETGSRRLSLCAADWTTWPKSANMCCTLLRLGCKHSGIKKNRCHEDQDSLWNWSVLCSWLHQTQTASSSMEMCDSEHLILCSLTLVHGLCRCT